MAITGKLVHGVEIRCRGKLLHEIYKYKPNDISISSPDKVQRCDLVSGQWGSPGSVISWHFMYDGNMSSAKEIIEAVDDEAHKIVFKVIEGEILESYSAVTFTIHIEDKGDKQLVTWTMDFEKVNASIPDPTPYLDLLCACTQDMDAHILKLA